MHASECYVRLWGKLTCKCNYKGFRLAREGSIQVFETMGFEYFELTNAVLHMSTFLLKWYMYV